MEGRREEGRRKEGGGEGRAGRGRGREVRRGGRKREKLRKIRYHLGHAK
jgi:hypothetical protein